MDVLPQVSFESLLAELQSLQPTKSYKQVIQAVNKAHSAHNLNQHDKALQFLLQASDRLIGLPSADVFSVRYQLDLLIATVAHKV